MTIVWDRLSAHFGAARRLREAWGDTVDFEYLSAYAPDGNPVDKAWAHPKYGELANFLPDDVEHLQHTVSTTLAAKRHNQSRLKSFFDQAHLPL